MQIHVAKSAGFCFGVREAVEKALESAKRPEGPIAMLGNIVHNEQVVERISAAGVQVKKGLDEITKGSLLIRAHGARKGLVEEARAKGLRVIDATCPMVTDIHKEVEGLEAEGNEIVIIGDHGHDEVVGIASHVKGNVRVVSKPEEVSGTFTQRVKRIGVVVQSTQHIENVQKIMAELVLVAHKIHFMNTICQPTVQHQRDIRDLPKENDVMIVIGSNTSANTMRLVELSRKINPKTFHVTCREDLQPKWFKGVKRVGIHAGASTPDWLIEEVIDGIKSLDTEQSFITWKRHVMGGWPGEEPVLQ